MRRLLKGLGSRGWICVQAALFVCVLTLDASSARERFALCAMVGIVAWPITAIAKVQDRPGLCALFLAGGLSLVAGGSRLHEAITHVGPGVVEVGGEEPGTGGAIATDEHALLVGVRQYRREMWSEAGVLFLLGGAVMWGAFRLWSERNQMERLTLPVAGRKDLKNVGRVDVTCTDGHRPLGASRGSDTMPNDRHEQEHTGG